MENTIKYTQERQVLEYLFEHDSITSWEAIQELRITRLSHYIYTLRKKGYKFETVREKNKLNKGMHTRYVLVDEEV